MEHRSGRPGEACGRRDRRAPNGSDVHPQDAFRRAAVCAARRLPRLGRKDAERVASDVTPCVLERTRRFSAGRGIRRLVGCYGELGGTSRSKGKVTIGCTLTKQYDPQQTGAADTGRTTADVETRSLQPEPDGSIRRRASDAQSGKGHAATGSFGGGRSKRSNCGAASELEAKCEVLRPRW